MEQRCPGSEAGRDAQTRSRTIVPRNPNQGTGQRDLLGVKRTIVRFRGLQIGQPGLVPVQSEQLLPVLEAADWALGQVIANNNSFS